MYGPCSSTTTRNPLVESSFARIPPAAPEPTTTKSTSSEVLYLGWSTVICSPLISLLIPSQGSPCRNNRRVAETCVRVRGQSLSTPHRHDSRRNPDRSGSRRWCAGGRSQKNSVRLDARGTSAASLGAAHRKYAETHPAGQVKAQRIWRLRRTSRRHALAIRAGLRRKSFGRLRQMSPVRGR